MIDTATFAQLQQDVGEDLAKQLLQVYLTESTQIVNDIADTTKQATISLNAHSLKSSSRSYGALSVGSIAEQIEHKAKAEQFDHELHNLIETLQDQFSLTLKHGNSLISSA
tara:strand:+ start:1339 stop:1671 length:333 start_codon:yes stop_codon:yes gene_type:complete